MKEKYLQLEMSFGAHWRTLIRKKDVKEWYRHLVTNPQRSRKFIFCTTFPKALKRVDEKKYGGSFCVIRLRDGHFMTEKEIILMKEEDG